MSDKDNFPRPQPDIGRMLQRARRARDLTLHQVEDATKIRTRYLADLERENFDALPPVYMQGSLKTYANYLGLDGAALARELKRRQEPPPEEPPTPLEPPKREPVRWSPLPAGTMDAETAGLPREEDLPGRTAVLRPYLFPVALLVLVLAGMSLVVALDGEPRRSAISEVREPTLSASIPRVYRAADEETASRPYRREDGEQSTEAGDRPGKRAEPDDKDGKEEAKQDRKKKEPDQPREPSGATASSSAPIASAKPPPEPRPRRASDASETARPEPPPRPVAARGGRGSGTNPRANPGGGAGGGAGGIVVEAGGLRITFPEPRNGDGPARSRRAGANG